MPNNGSFFDLKIIFKKILPNQSNKLRNYTSIRATLYSLYDLVIFRGFTNCSFMKLINASTVRAPLNSFFIGNPYLYNFNVGYLFI